MPYEQGGGPIPWFVADGTNVFWHPKAGVLPYGAAAGTSTAAQSIFANVTALAGKSKEGAKVWIESTAAPTGSALNIRADIYAQDESTFITSVIIGDSIVPVSPPPGPVFIPQGVHGATPPGGFCVKLMDITAGASPGAATYTARVYYTLESQFTRD